MVELFHYTERKANTVIMRNVGFFLLILISIIFIGFSTASALTTLEPPQPGGAINLEQSRTIDDNLAVAGSNIVISGTVNDDLIVAGSNIRIDGTVKGNVIAAGSNITIAGTVGKDVIAAGSTIIVDKAARIGRDLVSAGSLTTVDGTVERNVRNAGANLVINGTVNGDVSASAAAIQLGSASRVGGNLTYYNDREMAIPNRERVAGGVNFVQVQQAQAHKPNFAGKFFFSLLILLQSIVVGILLVLLVPAFLEVTEVMVRTEFLKSLGLGLLLLVAVPIVAFILAITIIGIPVAILVMLAYLLLVMVAPLVTAYYIGQLLGKSRWSKILAIIAGIAILWILEMIPILGFFVKIVAISVGLGAIFLAYPIRRTKKTEAPVE